MSARASLITGPVLPALLCLGLGAALYLELQRPPVSATVSFAEQAPEMSASDAEVPALFDLPPVDAYSEIATRPVFSPNRRPPDHFGEEEEVSESQPDRRRVPRRRLRQAPGPSRSRRRAGSPCRTG